MDIRLPRRASSPGTANDLHARCLCNVYHGILLPDNRHRHGVSLPLLVTLKQLRKDQVTSLQSEFQFWISMQ